MKWFRTYTEGTTPQPIYCSTTDASVYDLKDHPDFKFRPGSIVIRVMNKAGDDCGLGAGQVLDNQPSGQVRDCYQPAQYRETNVKFPSGECVVGCQRWIRRSHLLLATGSIQGKSHPVGLRLDCLRTLDVVYLIENFDLGLFIRSVQGGRQVKDVWPF